MSAKIYWGRPGSYKTSSAVKTDLPEFAFAGRVVVTNVRGLDNAERVRTVLEKKFKKKVPDSFEIINVESETSEGREKWARFFHWAPLGCAFIIDEVQDVWKKKWTATYINTLNYPGGADAAQADGRPFDFAISFEQHRHYNWDFVCTTPHIKRIRDDVREISDMAYKHINMALMGISGKYKQFGHDPDNNCRNDKDADTGRIGLVIPKWVFELYESTVTGDISDTRSGFKFWKEPKILILFGVGVLAWGYAIYNFPALKARFSGESKEPEMSQESNTVQGGQSSPPVPASKNKYFTDLSNLNVFYAGKVKVKGVINYLFNVEAPTEKQGSIVDGTFFQSLGYAIIEINKNMVMVGNDREQFYIKTKGVTNDKKCSSVLLFLLLAVSAFAEDIVLKDVPIKQALTYVSGITGKTYLYTGEDIKVTWEREGIPIGNVSREFDSILQKYNMELDYSGGTVFISKHGSTFNSSSVVVHRLSWIDAEALSKSLGDVWKESISITSFGDVLVLSGNRSSIEQLLLKIRKYDTPVATEIAQFRLEHAPAEKVVEVLNKDVDLKGMVNADSWSNSIIVRGHNFYQLIVESYCQKLDVPQQAQNYEIIDTVNLDAEVVVEALSEITDTAKVKLLSESKILVSGIPSDVQRVSEMVKQIDGQRVQVHITAVIALLNDQQYSELGLKLGYDNPGVSITTGILSAVYDPTFLISLLSSTTGVDVSATEGHSLSSVISEPSLTVKSGKTAELLVGKEVPIKTSESVSEEGSVTSTTIERKNVGVKLAVTPVVRGNFIDIKLYQEISSLSNGNSDVDITTNTESMSTELMLSNGQTMIIGGVKVVERNDMNEGVPVLRHVPVIGGILGYNSEDGERQNVVVSITANIIKEV